MRVQQWIPSCLHPPPPIILPPQPCMSCPAAPRCIHFPPHSTFQLEMINRMQTLSSGRELGSSRFFFPLDKHQQQIAAALSGVAFQLPTQFLQRQHL